jgi:cytoskeletal protein CcmA (bactofilin family)
MSSSSYLVSDDIRGKFWTDCRSFFGDNVENQEAHMPVALGHWISGRSISDLIKKGFLAVLEPGADIEGKLTVTSGNARLNSRFKGEIASDGTILVAERGEVEADIKSKSVVVLGKVRGSVQVSDRVEIKDRGVILGDIYTPVLIVEPGGFFDGQCHMPAQAPAEAKAPDTLEKDRSADGITLG